MEWLSWMIILDLVGSYDLFKTFYKRIQSEKDNSIISIRNSHGKEFKNQHFEFF